MTDRPRSIPPRIPRTHIWFRTELSMVDLVECLGVRYAEHDIENVWEWFIGLLDDLKVDVCRLHEPPSLEVDTCMYLFSGGEFTRREIERAIERLHRHGISPVHYGCRIYRGGDDYEFVTVASAHQTPDVGDP